MTSINVSNQGVMTEHDEFSECINFIKQWRKEYQTKIRNISLFSKDTILRIEEQREFAKLFYHIRGHFYKFLWALGNKLPTAGLKHIILHNIQEEFGGKALSHEELYYLFCDNLNVEIREEAIPSSIEIPFVKKFNEGHTQYIRHNNWQVGFSAFSAYELLDNVDYAILLKLVETFSFNSTKQGLYFFKLHANANHFETTSEELEALWKSNPQHVKAGFNFIASHQLEMWQKLSDTLLNM